METRKIMKNIDKIPEGFYCYSWIETPSTKNNFRGKVKMCPYYEHIPLDEETGESTAYCHFMEIEDIILLGDQCKVCGINEAWEEDDLEPLTEEQMAEIDKRIEDLDRWEKEGTLDEHTISHEELMKKIEKKYKIKGEEK